MRFNRENPLAPLRDVKMTKAVEARILEGLRQGMYSSEELQQHRPRKGRRRWSGIQSIAAGAAAVLIVGGTAWGLTQGHAKPGVASKQQRHSTQNGVVGFNAAKDWNPSNAFSYAPGITAVTPPQVPEGPAAFEQSTASKTGMAEITVSEGTTASPDNWTRRIIFSSSSLRINGQTYIAPALGANEKLLVLPLAHGIVWTATRQPAVDMSKQMLGGTTAIYYTPYTTHGGSLTNGAQRIASLPHSWRGPDGPTVASAWTGWLSANDVTMPHVRSMTTYHLQFGQQNQLISSAPVKEATKQWPTFYDQNLTKPSYDAQPPYAATVGSLTRTAGGFILGVSLQDATQTGRNAGLSSATYYWSENTGKWTPLTQLETVQTIGGQLATGSGVAYWIQPLPSGDGSGNALDVAEMYFDPRTLSIRSIWLGDWVYGPLYVDGESLVTVLAGDMPKTASGNPTEWVVYRPDSTIDNSSNSAASQSAFDTTLKLPNGQVLKPEKTLKWKQLTLQLQVTTKPPGASDRTIIDNHSTVMSHTKISTSAGQATLVLIQQTPPAAANSTKATYEYWVIHDGSQYVYAIKATVSGTDFAQAKAEVMQLVNGWTVPF